MASIGGLAVLGAVAAIAVAQAPPPTVAVTASPTGVTVGATGALPAGPTTFRVTRAASEQGLGVYFAVLVPGHTVEDLRAALEADPKTNNDSSLGVSSVQASTTLEGSQTTRDVTFTLKPGLTYVVVTEPQTEDSPPPTRGLTTFTTSGTANGATAPAPDATIRMVGLRFRGAQSLPRNGNIRVQNESGSPHIAIAFPLRRGVNTARLGRAVRSNSQRAFGRVVAGAPVTVQNILSGVASDDQQVTFSRAGRYALICFVNEHHKLGMYRIVNVR
jgi:hypothetical protein